MGQRTFMSVIFGIGLIIGIFGLAVVIRPGYMKFRTAFNDTVSNFNMSGVSNRWNKVMGTLDYAFWVVPIIAVLIILGWIYMSASQKEYVEAGYYR